MTYVCERCKQPSDDLRMYGRTADVRAPFCRPCWAIVFKERVKAKGGLPNWSKHRKIAPEVIAGRIERLRAGHKAYKDRLKHMKESGIVDIAKDADLQRITNKHWELLLMSLSGYDPAEIARALGYKHSKTVNVILRRPEIVRWREDVRKAQLERVLAGEFGVQAQARQAAPKVMRKIAAIAGADGVENQGQKDSDIVSAGKVVLQVSGDLVQEHRHQHVHRIFNEMSMEELLEYRRTGQWPQRMKGLAEKLGLGQAQLPAPSEGSV